MTTYILTISHAGGRIERHEVVADSLHAARLQALKLVPTGGTFAVREAPRARYPQDFEPSVPAAWSESACLGSKWGDL